jgi:hypothetical protein
MPALFALFAGLFCLRQGKHTVAKIKLDLEPTDVLSFDRVVPIPTPDGKSLKVTFTFKYRDRESAIKYFDEYREQLVAFVDGEQSDALAKTLEYIEFEVRTIMDVASGWNIDAPWDATNLRKLLVKYAGAGSAIMADYRVSLTQGRLGN